MSPCFGPKQRKLVVGFLIQLQRIYWAEFSICYNLLFAETDFRWEMLWIYRPTDGFYTPRIPADVYVRAGINPYHILERCLWWSLWTVIVPSLYTVLYVYSKLIKKIVYPFRLKRSVYYFYSSSKIKCIVITNFTYNDCMYVCLYSFLNLKICDLRFHYYLKYSLNDYLSDG